MAAFPAAWPTSPCPGRTAARRLRGAQTRRRVWARALRFSPACAAHADGFLGLVPQQRPDPRDAGGGGQARGHGLFLSTLAWGRGALLQLEKEGQSSRLACSRGQACAGGARLRQASPHQQSASSQSGGFRL